MEKMFLRSLIVSLACLAIVACGKSKDGSSSIPAEAKGPTQTSTQDPTVDPNQKPDANKPNPIPNPNEGRHGPTRHEKEGQPGATPDGKPGTTPGSQPGTPGANGDTPSQQNPGKQKGDTPSQQNPGKQSAPPVSQDSGSLIAESERYSGSASDGLRELLIYREMQKSEDQKGRNAKFASTIQKARLNFNAVIGKILITLTIGKNEVGFVGTSKEGKAIRMASNAHGFTGTLTCMDQKISTENTCETSVAEIKYNDNATVQIIFRQTSIATSVVFPARNCSTQACEDFYNLFRYTERQINDKNTIKIARLETSEVILGRSDFSLLVLTHDDQVMRMSAPLANPEMYPTLDTPVDRTLGQDDLVDPATRQVRKTRMNEDLNDVRLVLNDGRGHLNFLVKMKMQAGGKADTFQIRLERKLRPIVLPAETVRTADN